MKILETERLILREIEDSDFEDLKSVISDPINMKYYPKPYDDAGVNKWIEWCKASYKKNGFGLWAVVLKENNKFIGDCGLSLQNINGELLPEIGYHLNIKYQHNGYIKEAAEAVKNYIFNNFSFDEVYSYMNENNIPSKCVAIRNGMLYKFSYLDDEKLSVYSITRKRWKDNSLFLQKDKTILNRIILLGPPCSGKSFLSKKLSEKLHLSLYHLDVIFWKPNWVATPRDEFLDKINNIIKEDKWIIDGTYVSTLYERLVRCDTVVVLDFDPNECVKNESLRRGKKRDDLPSYLKEEYDPEFIEYIKNYPNEQMKVVKAYLSLFPNKKIIYLHNRKEMSDFVDNFI